MKKTICTLLSLSLLAASASNFQNAANVSAAEPQSVSADCAAILAGIYADAENRDYEVKDSSGADIAVVTAGYGTIGSNEQAFTTYTADYFAGDNWTWITSKMAGDYYWHGNSGTYGRDVFLKAEIKRDSCLNLSHVEITGQRTDNDETFVEVLVMRDGREYVVSSVERGNTGTNAANSLLSDAGNVKAGDTVYVSVSSQWEARAYFNPVFTFEEPKETQIDVSVGSPELIRNIAADTADRTAEIAAEFTPYLSVTAGYGTIGTDEKAFDTYDKNYFAKVENGDKYTWLAGADNEYYWWKAGNPDESVFYKATVMEDCWLGLSHAAVAKQRSDYGWSKVAVILKRGDETKVVSEVTRSAVDVRNEDNTLSTPANSLLKNVGNVKKGDVVYVAVIGNENGVEVRFDPVFTVKATDKVEEAKSNAKTELETYVSLDDYREAEKTQVNEAIAAGKTAIDGADSVEKVTEALAKAKAAIDEVKTDEELTEEAKALADAKSAAKAELETYVSLDDYREAEKTQVNEAIAAGKTAIDGADSVEKVTEALAKAKAAIDEVKTDEELTEEEGKTSSSDSTGDSETSSSDKTSSGSSSGSGNTTVNGCGSAIGLGTGAAVILGAAACLLKKRKR